MAKFKSIIIKNDFFSIQINFNKIIDIPEWYLPFLSKSKSKKNIEINVIFNKKLNKTFIEPKILFFLYDNNHFKRVTITLETILNYLHTSMNLFLLHSSCLSINSLAYLFVADPESGKTTIVRKMKNEFEVIHDEKLIIHNFQFVSPLPHSYNTDLISNKTLPIGTVFLIKKSKYNLIKEISNKEKKKILRRNITTSLMERDIDKFVQSNNIKLLYHNPFNKSELKKVLIDYDNYIFNRKL